jgi:adenylosuccinate lyase
MSVGGLLKLKKLLRINPERIAQIEQKIKHDVVAFVSHLAEQAGEAGKYLHYGMTSSDVLDTALGCQMKEAVGLLIARAAHLQKILAHQAKRHAKTVMMGRTHGVHAEPTTLGLKLALWYEEIGRDLDRLKGCRDRVAVGKISGAVGTFAHLPPRVEQFVCQKLGLKPAKISTQVIQRDRHAEFLSVIALVGATLEKIATEIRHLQRTEVREIEEPFEPGQKGSSAMPHKRNPVRCERVSGLERLLRGNAIVGMENVALWHERDISHSSVERVILPDSCIALDFMLAEMCDITERLLVYPERMKENIESSGGLIFSQRVLLMLVTKGMARDDAYALVQSHAMQTWKEKIPLKRLLLADPRIQQRLSYSELEGCFDLSYYLKNVDVILRRVLKAR